jgi:hypothetical protein
MIQPRGFFQLVIETPTSVDSLQVNSTWLGLLKVTLLKNLARQTEVIGMAYMIACM